MRKIFFQVLLAAAVWLMLAGVSSAYGRDHGGGHGHGHADVEDGGGHGHGHGADRGDHDRDEGRGDRDRDDSGRPPGWSHGKKTGWGNCDMPPGLAKKNGGCDNDRDYHHEARRTTTHRVTRTATRPIVRPRTTTRTTRTTTHPRITPRTRTVATKTTTTKKTGITGIVDRAIGKER